MATYLLPGMGANASMYQGPWRQTQSDLRFLDWPPYQGEHSLKEIAQRIIEEHQLQSDDCVGGSSMGGMVALEIAALLDCQTLYLIGSALQPQEINRFLHALAPIAQITPLRFTQLLAGKSGCALSQMFVESDTEFIRAMCLAIHQWQGVDFPSQRVRRVHGAKDLVIPCPKYVHGIAKAGHLIAMTHPELCVELLEL